jgi:hypothetical protein
MVASIMLLTFNPGKEKFGIPFHTYHPAWLVVSFLILIAIISFIIYINYKKELKSGLTKEELERRALEDLPGKKFKRTKKDAKW